MSTATEIDFSKYRRPELAEHLSSIVSLPGTLKTVATWTAVSLVVSWIAVSVVFAEHASWMMLGAVACYATVWAISSGALLGIVVLVNRRVGKLVQVFDITLEISEHVSSDCADIRDGAKGMPTPRQVVVGVFDGVVMPALHGVLRGQSRLLGSAMFGIYRWTLGRLMNGALRDAPHRSGTLVSALAGDEAAATATLESIEGAAAGAGPWIAEVRAYLATMGSRVRRVVVVPLACLTACGVIGAALPIVAMGWAVYAH